MQTAFSWLVEGPAWAIGGLLAAALHIAFLFGPALIGIKIGGWVEQRAGIVAAWIAGIATWVYVSLVLVRSGTWMAVATLRAIKEMDLN